MPLRSFLFISLACVPLAACGTTSDPRAASGAPADQAAAFDATTFVPAGFETLRVVRGHLNADDLEDALVVATRHRDAPDAKTAARALSVVISRPDGTFELSAVNTTLAACATCGGRFGDGLVITSIENREIVVVNEGGSSRYGWSNVYTFGLDPDNAQWVLRRYRAGVSSQPDQRFKRIEQTAADFGVRAFVGFAPQDLTIPTLD